MNPTPGISSNLSKVIGRGGEGRGSALYSVNIEYNGKY